MQPVEYGLPGLPRGAYELVHHLSLANLPTGTATFLFSDIGNINIDNNARFRYQNSYLLCLIDASICLAVLPRRLVGSEIYSESPGS